MLGRGYSLDQEMLLGQVVVFALVIATGNFLILVWDFFCFSHILIGYSTKCRVCQDNYINKNGVIGGKCKSISDVGKSVDFNSNVKCLHFTDGKNSWKGATEKSIAEQCYYHGQAYADIFPLFPLKISSTRLIL